MKFIVVTSSAGSGKTYTLVKHYLMMLLKVDDLQYYGCILAITFTNKATNEMKQRVLEALDGISEGKKKYKNLTEEISAELNIPEEEIVRKSENILRNLIHDYARFSISTIDRFVYKIIRSFAFELNIPGNAEIELNRDSILRKSIDALLDQMPQDKELVNILVEFAEYKFRQSQSLQVEKDLLSMASEVINARAEPFFKELEEIRPRAFNKLRLRLRNRLKEIETSMKAKAAELAVLIKENGIEPEEISGGKSALPKYLSFFTGSNFEMKEPYSRVLKIQESGNWKGSKVGKERASEIDGISTALSAVLDELIDLFNELQPTYEFCQLLLGRIHSMALVNEIHREIALYKKENDIVQLEDFNTMIGKLVDDSPVPYIYERIGEKYHHYLIDEFQDTSQIQWYNLLPLVENSLSEGHESLLVGDVKQAIYRFRGGDVSQMSRLPALHFPDRPETDTALREEVLTSQFEMRHLDSNYRSSKAIVSFVNNFFEKIVSNFPEETASIYSDHKQKPVVQDVSGSVDIRFLPPKTEDNIRLEKVKEGIEQYAGIGYGYGDMAILCRKRDQCTATADYLIQHDIPVISSESLKLASSDEVNFLINWMRYLKESQEDRFSFPVLQYLSDMNRLGKMSNDDMVAAWKSGEGIKKILNSAYPEFNMDQLPSNSLPELCTSLTHTFLGILSTDPFVVNFIDQVSKFQESWGNDAIQFLEWWDEKGITIDVEMPEKNDAVKIMTIHKAKGLEFKVVIIPFVFSEITPGVDHFWVRTKGSDKDLIPLAWLPANKKVLKTSYAQLYDVEMSRSFIDALNLMYVAMTRAAHHLMILSCNQKTKENKYREDNLLWKCFELEEYRGSEESGLFFTGSLDKWKDESENFNDDDFIYTNVEDYDWKDRINLKFRADNSVLSDEGFSAREYGNMIHDILAHVRFLDEIPAVLQQYEYRGLISKEDASELLKNITNTIKDSEIESFYNRDAHQIFNERELLSDNGKVFRPDRMVIREDDVTVIDYKTGMPDKLHEEQILTYINVLKQLGKKHIRGYLLYIGQGEVKKVA